ncbi:MAG: extracellular solute-binding protein [Candidatus Hydrogenedentes bacterium]|nr:extracellular solute-binding protein [Candidatus Hydrogenedentota bacterium]
MYRRFPHSLCGVLFLAMMLFVGCDAIHRDQADPGITAEVEMAVFEGGYGIQWHQKVAEQYNETHTEEGIRVKLWGDPRVIEKVKPRLLRGDPPDLMLMKYLPIWRLVAADKLAPLNAALDRPLPGRNRPWREEFIPGTLDTYTSEGQVYAIPSAFGAYACWYDARLFREHGWVPPKTWAEFETLCEAIKAAGIAPLAYQGKYPIYAWWTFQTLIHRCGGLTAVNRINALEPGAFSHPDVVWAAGLLQKLGTEYFQKGALAMTHTESQLQFINNKAAMIFCGLWLSNEMKASTPPTFEMRCFNVPPIEGGKGNPALFNGAGWEYIFMSKTARYPEATFDFLRYMVSPEQAADMGRSVGVITAMKGATPPEAVTPPLRSALKMIDGAEGIFRIRLEDLLLSWRVQVMRPNTTALLSGTITPEEYCKRLDEGVVVAVADPDAIIPPHVAYDPAAFGETP